MAVPLLFALNRLTFQSARMTGITEAVLYADGAFLVIISAIHGVVLALVGHATKELDIISTELEKCYAQESFAYWIIRGDLQFYVESLTQPSWLELFEKYAQYVVFLPFCLLFALMLKGRYSASAILNFTFGMSAFVLVNLATDLGIEKLRSYMFSNSRCVETSAANAARLYSPDMLNVQIADQMNADLVRVLGSNRPIMMWRENGFHMDLTLPRTLSQIELRNL